LESGGTNGRAVFEILVREHADMLMAYLRTLMGPDSSIDDVFQEVLLVAWRRLEECDRTQVFGAWLRGIAQVLVMEHCRKARRRPVVTAPEILVEIDRRFDDMTRQAGESFRERTERLLGCVGKLPEAMREALDLVYGRGLAIAAAAQSIGASEEGMKKRVQRARQLVAECLGISGESESVNA
jgi:RNA polymerase sigma-70 factor (ECF subfamily)